MEAILLNKKQLSTLQNGEVVTDCEKGYVGLFNGKPYLLTATTSVKFSKVLPCNQQDNGVTTLSGKENQELEDALKTNPNATITIYRGTAYDDNGNVINKDITNDDYTSRVTKVIISGDLDSNNKLCSVRIVDQIRAQRYKAKEPVRISLEQYIEF